MNSIELKIMTFNMRYFKAKDPFLWEQRRQWIVKLIKNYQPDIIGSQEVTDEMFAWLQKNLSTQYDMYGVNRSAVPGRGESCTIFTLKERLDMLYTNSFMLSPTPDIIGSIGWDARLERICSWANIALKGEGAPFIRFFNTHLDHKGETAKIEGLRLILSMLADINSDTYLPSVITGDFNTNLGSAVFDVLEEFDPMSNCYDAISPEERENTLTFHGYQGGAKGLPIDYILGSKGITFHSTQIIRDTYEGGYPSDHYPVLSVIEVERY